MVKQIIREWSPIKKWTMGIVGCVLLSFAAYITSGANDGKQALKETCELKVDVNSHKKESGAIISDMSERIARIEKSTERIEEDTKMLIKMRMGQ